jgi:regulator of replication initiation timing
MSERTIPLHIADLAVAAVEAELAKVKAERDQLKAEVGRLTGNLKTEQNTGWDMVAENVCLKAEVERLTEAGDAMAKEWVNREGLYHANEDFIDARHKAKGVVVVSEPKRYAILGVLVEGLSLAEEVTSEMIAVPNGAWVRHEDYARLKALTTEMDKTINASQAECRRLKAEVESLMTNPTSRLLRVEREENARLKAEVERLTTAGDAMQTRLNFFQKRWDNDELCEEAEAWNAAKEGKQS